MKLHSSIVLAMVFTLPTYAASVNYSNYSNYSNNAKNITYERSETRTRTRTYSPAAANSDQMYKPYNRVMSPTRGYAADRSGITRTQARRKYYLAHPFFQPLEGKFGIVSDASYNMSSYDMNFIPVGTMSDTAATWNMKQFALKEDLSFGITDWLSIVIMGRYDSSKYTFDWSASETDKLDDSGLNIYGAGVMWRFVDNDKWIGGLSGHFQKQRNVADEFVADLKLGYKVAKSTVYGLARTWMVDFENEYYGNGISGIDNNGVEEAILIAYDIDAKRKWFGEGGLGVFSVLGEDWALNLETVFGFYDWHNQASVRGAIGWQPNDWFALNLYAKTVFYDTANNKTLDFYGTESGIWGYMGTVKLDKYNETSFGGQVILYF